MAAHMTIGYNNPRIDWHILSRESLQISAWTVYLVLKECLIFQMPSKFNIMFWTNGLLDSGKTHNIFSISSFFQINNYKVAHKNKKLNYSLRSPTRRMRTSFIIVWNNFALSCKHYIRYTILSVTTLITTIIFSMHTVHAWSVYSHTVCWSHMLRQHTFNQFLLQH